MISRIWRWSAWPTLAVVILVVLGACGSGTQEAGPEHPSGETETSSAISLEPVFLNPGEKLKVVATTNILGDVVRNVGGDRIDLTVLMGIGIDPHTYVPTPSDTAAIHDAHLVLASGAGLEADLAEMFENAGGNAVEIEVSSGLELRPMPGGTEEGAGAGQDHDHGAADPHVWFDVQNVIFWVQGINGALGNMDPDNAAYYAENAQRYIGLLEDLDAWVVEQVTSIPDAKRKLVSNHTSFGYLAGRYGFEELGAVYPVSPSAEPSAQDIAALEDAIREHGVPAVFIETTVRPGLAQQVAEDTGASLVSLYTGSLGAPGSGVESYIDLIRFDVSAIVRALQ